MRIFFHEIIMKNLRNISIVCVQNNLTIGIARMCVTLFDTFKTELVATIKFMNPCKCMLVINHIYLKSCYWISISTGNALVSDALCGLSSCLEYQVTSEDIFAMHPPLFRHQILGPLLFNFWSTHKLKKTLQSGLTNGPFNQRELWTSQWFLLCSRPGCPDTITLGS